MQAESAAGDELNASVVSIDIDPAMFDGVEVSSNCVAAQELLEVSAASHDPLDTSGVYGFGPELPMEIERTQVAQRHASSARWSNEQLRGGELTGWRNGVDAGATQIAAELSAQATTHSIRRVSQERRYHGAESATKYSTDSVQISNEMKAQNTITEYTRVNQQVIKNVEPPTMPMESIDITRTRTSQKNIAAVRIVNEQIKAPHAQFNLYGAGGVQVHTEAKAQANLHKVRRVNDEVRGANAGQQHKYGSNAREMQRHLKSARPTLVNEQIRGNTNVGTITTNALEVHRALTASGHTSAARAVNEQVRGETAGLPTKFSLDSREMKRQTCIERPTLINEQIRAVKSGTIPADAVDFTRVKSAQLTLATAGTTNAQIRPCAVPVVDATAIHIGNALAVQRNVTGTARINNEIRVTGAQGWSGMGFDFQQARKVSTTREEDRKMSYKGIKPSTYVAPVRETSEENMAPAPTPAEPTPEELWKQKKKNAKKAFDKYAKKSGMTAMLR